LRKGEKVPQVQSSSAKCSQVTTSVGKEKWVLLMLGMYEGRTAPSATYPESVVGIGAWAIAMLLIASSSVVPLF